MKQYRWQRGPPAIEQIEASTGSPAARDTRDHVVHQTRAVGRRCLWIPYPRAGLLPDTAALFLDLLQHRHVVPQLVHCGRQVWVLQLLLVDRIQEILEVGHLDCLWPLENLHLVLLAETDDQNPLSALGDAVEFGVDEGPDHLVVSILDRLELRQDPIEELSVRFDKATDVLEHECPRELLGDVGQDGLDDCLAPGVPGSFFGSLLAVRLAWKPCRVQVALWCRLQISRGAIMLNVFAVLQVWEVFLDDQADLLVDVRSEDVLVFVAGAVVAGAVVAGVVVAESLKGKAGAVVAGAI